MSEESRSHRLEPAGDPVHPEPLTYEQKWETASRLFWSAVEMKKAFLKATYPELSEEDIKKQVRDWILYART